MKLNIVIIALALSSSVLTLAAPLPKPMPQGGSWRVLKNAVGKITGKSKPAAQPTSIYADEYISEFPELSDDTHPYIPKEHRASGGESSSKSGNQHSPEASPVHRSHGGGDSSRPAERDPRHGGDESGHSTSPPDGNYVGTIHMGPPDSYYRPQHDPHILQNDPHTPQYFPQYTPHTPQYFPQYTPHISQHYPHVPQYTHAGPYPPPGEIVPQHPPHIPQYFPQYTPHISQHYPHVPQYTHAGPYPPPGEIVPQHSPHDDFGYPVGEHHRSPSRQDGFYWYR
ncbi:uncharacterized protein UDID_19049 [Ustilago sp. UG-2017a]|nr:uncharacterized protein UDID_19049 [Ustilago sp. UG-2017a]